MRRFRTTIGLLVFLMIVSAVLIAKPNVTYACSCAMGTTVQEELQRKTAVFSGTVVDVQTQSSSSLFQSTADPVMVTLAVDQVWKGQVKSREVIHTVRDTASCGFDFKKGNAYLVYAYVDEGRLSTNLCDRTALLTSAGGDLAVLGTGAAPLPAPEPVGEQKISLVLIAASTGLLIAVLFAVVYLIRKRRNNA